MEYKATFIFAILITGADSSLFTNFYEHSSLEGKICKTNAYNTVFGLSLLACASKCVQVETCESFFYSNISMNCAGCTETYTSAGQATGTLTGSVYYAKTQPTPPPSYTYLGCYKADCNGQPCNPDRLTYNGAMTIEICYSDCQGNSVFAAKNVNCFCDPEYSTVDTGCTYSCPGDSSQTCGGTYSMSLFRYD